jgi:hypothetical protein
VTYSLRRDPKLVARDVEHRLVSPEFARTIYGVVLDPDGGPNDEETEELRATIRRERREPSQAGRPMPAGAGATVGPRPDEQPIGALSIVDGWVCCGECRRSICQASDDFKEFLARDRGPLGSAGPRVAQRWNGDSPDFELWRYFCPHCGELCAVEQHLKSEGKAWTDYAVAGTDDRVAD